MSITWAITLEDLVSGPADAAARAMSGAAAKARGLSGEMSLLRDAAMGASAAAATVVAAVGAGAVAAIEASEDVRRLTSVFDALGAASGTSGAATLSMLREIEKQVPQNEATLASWARQLEAVGVTDLSQLRDSIKAVAAAEALLPGAGSAVTSMLAGLQEQAASGSGKLRFNFKQLASVGLSQDEFLSAIGMTAANFNAAKKAGTLTGTQVSAAITKALTAKGAGAVAAQMGELSTMFTKAGDSLKQLFEGVDVEPLTEGVRSFFEIFDQATPSGQVLKASITGAFNAVMRFAGRAFALLREGFLHAIIFGLQVALAWKQLPATMQRFRESVGAAVQRVKDLIYEWTPAVAGVAAAITTLFIPSMYAAAAAAFSAFVPAIYASIAGAVAWAVTAIPAALVATGAYIASMAAAAIATIAATWPILAIAAAVGLVVYGIIQLVRHWDEVSTFFAGLAKGAWDAAVGFVDGLVNGITGGVGRAVNAVKGLGNAVVGGLKDLLGIHSPSAVLFEMGMHTSAGFAGGIAAGSGAVADAGVGLSDAASGGAGGATGAGRGGGGVTVNFGGITVQIDTSHATTPVEARSMVEEQLATLAERLALMIGSAPEPA